ncbi:hypothetical protein OG21DRAFT_1093595 [Imleria badia]|nr:hypothetical protein OG21DRAFT_1093595 [Imleria badia]
MTATSAAATSITYALLQRFAIEFETKYRSLAENASRKSVNSEGPSNHERVDASSELSRAWSEKLIAAVLDRIALLLQSSLSIDRIDAVKLIGGATRLLCIRCGRKTPLHRDHPQRCPLHMPFSALLPSMYAC